MIKKILMPICITLFFSIHAASYRFIDQAERLIAASNALHQDIFNFVLENEEKPLTKEVEYTIKLLIRTIPEKTNNFMYSLVKYQTIPLSSYCPLLKRILKKIAPLEKSYERIAKKKNYGIHGKEKVEAVFEQLITLKEDVEHSLAFIKKTDTFFCEQYSSYNQDESIFIQSFRLLFRIATIGLFIYVVRSEYILHASYKNFN